ALGGLPVILEINSQLLGSSRKVKGRIAVGNAHAVHSARSSKSVRVNRRTAGGGAHSSQDAAGICLEINLQSGAEFEEASQSGFLDEIKATLEGVVAPGL